MIYRRSGFVVELFCVSTDWFRTSHFRTTSRSSTKFRWSCRVASSSTTGCESAIVVRIVLSCVSKSAKWWYTYPVNSFSLVYLWSGQYHPFGHLAFHFMDGHPVSSKSKLRSPTTTRTTPSSWIRIPTRLPSRRRGAQLKSLWQSSCRYEMSRTHTNFWKSHALSKFEHTRKRWGANDVVQVPNHVHILWMRGWIVSQAWVIPFIICL